jgi:transposase-like protein
MSQVSEIQCHDWLIGLILKESEELMSKSSKFRLTPEQLQIVEADLTNPRHKYRRRAQALKLLHEGHSVTAVAEELGVSRQAIYDWIAKSGVGVNQRQQEIAFVQATLTALEERDWDFEELLAVLE